MTRHPDNGHLSAEMMQAFLDGEASVQEAHRVEEHRASCARCRSEMEAWTTLFGDLSALDRVAPASDFASRVLDSVSDVTVSPSLAARVKALFGRRDRAPVSAGGHVDATGLQGLLDGTLAPARTVEVEAHLHGCGSCRADVEAWRGVFVELADLGRFEPSDAFQERVMAHVRIQTALSAARPSLRERFQLAVASVSPDTRKRLAAFAGAAVTPGVTLGLAAYAVLSHPMVTIGSLLTFLFGKVSAVVATFLGGAQESLSQSLVLSQLTSAFDFLASTPLAALGAVATLSGLLVVASWIVYRNVLAAPLMDRSYAR